MMLIERDHDALAAETDYRLERAGRSYDRGRRRRSGLRSAASRLRPLSRRSDRAVARPAGSDRTPTAVSHHAAAH